MGRFSGLREARPTQGGVFLEPQPDGSGCNYTLQIQRVKMQDSQAKKHTEWFISEFKVIESEHEKLKPGQQPSWLCELPGEWPELSLGNIKAFLHAAYSSMAMRDGDEPPDDSEIGDDEAEAAVDEEEGLLVGVFVTAYAYNKVTKGGNDFTRIKWGVPDNLDELIEAHASAA